MSKFRSPGQELRLKRRLEEKNKGRKRARSERAQMRYMQEVEEFRAYKVR